MQCIVVVGSFYVGIPNRTGVLTVGNSNRTVARRRRNRVYCDRSAAYFSVGMDIHQPYLTTFIIIIQRPFCTPSLYLFATSSLYVCSTFFYDVRGRTPLPTCHSLAYTKLYGGTTILNLQTLGSCFWETLKVACPKLTVPTLWAEMKTAACPSMMAILSRVEGGQIEWECSISNQLLVIRCIKHNIIE